MRIAINGFGRIGRTVLRAAHLRKAMTPSADIDIVAINEPADDATIAHLTRYDSTHGRFPGEVGLGDGQLVLSGDPIQLLHIAEIDSLPWAALNVDLVLECTGSFSSREMAEHHLHCGAQRVLFSQPADTDVDATVIWGLNDAILSADQQIISAGSCTSNALMPVLSVLHDHFGIRTGTMTTIHSAMNDQPVLDAYHNTDLRKTRAAFQSIIPVDTGLALGIARILPELADRFTAHALRVPTLNVSAIDLAVYTETPCSAAAVNAALKDAASGSLSGVLSVSEEPLASCDFVGEPASAIIDAHQTQVSSDHLVKVLIWFDNEWAYANRLLDIAERLSRFYAPTATAGN
jgi:D-erythrose 4-phosphate dehydrogenase